MIRIAKILPPLVSGSFGCLGAQARSVVQAFGDGVGSTGGGVGRLGVLKGLAVRRIRGSLSVALHMALSDRVMAYMATPGVCGVVGGNGGGLDDLFEETLQFGLFGDF